jgi:hypothetical protein
VECSSAQDISDEVTVVCLVLLIVCPTFFVSCRLIRSLIETDFGENGKIGVNLFYGDRNLKRMAYQAALINSVLAIQLQLLLLLLLSSSSKLLVVDSVNLAGEV